MPNSILLKRPTVLILLSACCAWRRASEEEYWKRVTVDMAIALPVAVAIALDRELSVVTSVSYA